jgi:hypothetical protein
VGACRRWDRSSLRSGCLLGSLWATPGAVVSWRASEEGRQGATSWPGLCFMSGLKGSSSVGLYGGVVGGVSPAQVRGKIFEGKAEVLIGHWILI